VILFGQDAPLAFWLEQDPAARALRCDLLDRQALRAELDRLPPGGEAALVLDARGCAERGEEADRAVQEFSVWAEARSLRPRVVLVSDEAVYGILKPGVALREQDAAACDAASAAMLALEQQLVARARRRGFGLAVARLFELIDPREPGERLVELARRVREGRMKGVPGLGATRDYLDARDAALALRALARLPDSPTVNVCSGRPVTGHDLLRALARLLRPADEMALMAQAEPAEGPVVPWIVGNPSRFAAVVGASAACRTFEQTIQDACGLL